MSVLQVEFGAPGYSPSMPATSNGDLTYHAPAFLAAIEDCNRLYAGFLNFTLTFILAENATHHDIHDDSPGLIAQWYYRGRQFPADGVPSILFTCESQSNLQVVYHGRSRFCA